MKLYVSCEGVQRHMPWLKGAVVKESIGNFACDSMSPKSAQALIRAAARDAVVSARDAKPFAFEAPITMEIDVARVEQADLIELIPQFERAGNRTVRFTHDDYPTIFRAFAAAFRMGASA